MNIMGMFRKMLGSTSTIMKVLGGALLLVGGVAVVALSKDEDTGYLLEDVKQELPEVIETPFVEVVEEEETVTE